MHESTALAGLAVFYVTTLACATLGSILARRIGWTFGSTGWSVIGTAIMWAPALGWLVATRTVDRSWVSPFSLSTWGAPRAAVILIPAAIEIGIYALSYAIALPLGRAQWSPDRSGGRLALSLAINLPLLMAIGFFVSAGEELGWRGYLQPRLEQIGMPHAVVLVGLLWAAFHLPVMALAGYDRAQWGVRGFTLVTITCIGDSYLWWRVCRATGSLYPAIWFHAFHNIASQWLAPRFFRTDAPALLGEHGAIPALLHAATAIAVALLFPSASPP